MSRLKIKIIAIFLVIIAILGTATGLIGYYSNGFKNWDKFNPLNWFKKEPVIESEIPNDGIYLDPIFSNGIAVQGFRVAAEDLVNASVPDGTESAYKITATLDTNQSNVDIDWSVAWLNDNGWSSDKEVSDYITLSSNTTKSGESLSVFCHQDFGKQIIITAISNFDSTKNAICQVDYIKRIKSMNYVFKYNGAEISGITADENGINRFAYTGEAKNYEIIPNPVYSNYTLDKNYSVSIVGKFTEEFGLGNNIELDTISIGAGIREFASEPPITDNIKNYKAAIDRILSRRPSNSDTGVVLYFTDLKFIDTAYEELTPEEKSHPRVLNYVQVVNYMKNRIGSIQQTFWISHFEEMDAILNSYEMPGISRTFMDKIDVPSERSFLQGCLNCNKASKGILEFTIKYSAGDFDYNYELKLGFTTESIEKVFGIDIDNPNIEF